MDFLRSPFGLIPAALLLSIVAGCHSAPAPLPSAPPLMTYEQAYRSASQREMGYAEGYSSIGFNPPISVYPAHPFIAKRIYTAWPPSGRPESPSVTTEVTIARDANGRIHYESSQRPGDVDVIIFDPVDEIQYRYAVSRRAPLSAQKCTQPSMKQIRRRSFADPVPLASGVRFELASYAQQQTAKDSVVQDRTEELGIRDFEGVLAYGQRRHMISTTQYGTNGMTWEVWFSPDLGLNLLDVKENSRQNSSRIATQNIRFDAPDPSLFVPPPNYSIPATVPSCIPIR